jgi:hypothetical protein
LIRRAIAAAGALVLAAVAARADARKPDAAGADRVRADVARLSDDAWQGRRAGTEGADQAAVWVARRFQEIGLGPAGDRGSFFQAFTFIDGVILGKGNRLALVAAGTRREGKVEADFRPLAFSAPGQVQAPVVFAGYGIASSDLGYDDYAGLDVKDKVVVVLRYGPTGDDPHSRWAAFTPLRMKVAAARERGARAVLVVTGPGTKDAPDELVALRADASLVDAGLPAFSVRRALVEPLFAAVGTTLEAAQAKIDGSQKPAPLALGESRIDAVADLTPRRSTTRNVVGRLGPADAAEAIVVGAHYDHLGLGTSGSLDPRPEGKVHHGADDNASGVAGMLELAHRLASRPSPKRAVVFVAFGAEELGTLGSSYFVKNAPLPFERVMGMFNLDMVGRLREDALDVHGVGTSPAFPPLVEEAAKATSLKPRLHQGGFGPSDHSPFYAAGKPVLFVFTGSHSDYHRPSDTADKVDAAGVVRAVSFLEPIVDGVLDAPTALAFTRVKAEQEQEGSASRGFRVYVGGVPDYSEETVGVKFSGVSPGSPAEKAGLQAGDVLVKFGSKEIRNIYDYTYALGEKKPGEEVVLVVKRAGQDVALTVVLGSRPSATR